LLLRVKTSTLLPSVALLMVYTAPTGSTACVALTPRQMASDSAITTRSVLSFIAVSPCVVQKPGVPPGDILAHATCVEIFSVVSVGNGGHGMITKPSHFGHKQERQRLGLRDGEMKSGRCFRAVDFISD